MSGSPRKRQGRNAVAVDQGADVHVGSTFDREHGRLTVKLNRVCDGGVVGASVTAKVVVGESPGEIFGDKDVRITVAPTKSMQVHFKAMEEAVVAAAELLLAKKPSKKQKTSKGDLKSVCALSMRDANLSDGELETLVAEMPGLLSVQAPGYWNAKVAVKPANETDGTWTSSVVGITKLAQMSCQKGVGSFELYVTIRGEDKTLSLTARMIGFLPLKKDEALKGVLTKTAVETPNQCGARWGDSDSD